MESLFSYVGHLFQELRILLTPPGKFTTREEMHPFVLLNMSNGILEHTSAGRRTAAPARPRVDRQNEETIAVVDGVELGHPLIKYFGRWCIAEFVKGKVVEAVRIVGQL